MEQKRKATLDLGDGSQPLEFPLLSGTMGPDVVDIRTLHAKGGVFTYDPGFLSTASSNSKITFIDGDKGILLYRGYPIEQLAEAVRLHGSLLFADEWGTAHQRAKGIVR